MRRATERMEPALDAGSIASGSPRNRMYQDVANGVCLCEMTSDTTTPAASSLPQSNGKGRVVELRQLPRFVTTDVDRPATLSEPRRIGRPEETHSTTSLWQRLLAIANAVALATLGALLLAPDTSPLEQRLLPPLPESISGDLAYRGNPGRTGVLPDNTGGPLRVDGFYWRKSTAAQIAASPVIQGKWVFVAGADGVIRAFELRTGNQLWSVEAAAALRATPAVAAFEAASVGGSGGPRSVIVFADENGLVYLRDAFAPARSPYAHYQASGRIAGAPLVVDSRVILASTAGEVFALSDSGELEWMFEPRDGKPLGPIVGAPAFHDGIVYVVTSGSDGRLYLIDAATGAEKCSSLPIGNLDLPPVIANEVVYLSTEMGIYAIAPGTCRIAPDAAPEGRRLLYAFNGNGITAPPVVVGDLMVVPSGPDLIAIDLRGFDASAYEWKFESGAPIHSAPIVAGEVIYFGNDDGNVFAVPLHPEDSADVRALWRWRTNGPVRSSVAVADGVAFITSRDGTITAVGPRGWESPDGDSTFAETHDTTTTVPETPPTSAPASSELAGVG